MKIFPERKEKAPRIGRLSPIDVEINDSSDDGFYYFGRVEVFDTEVHLEGEDKPKNIFFYRTLAKYREDERLIMSTEDFIANADNIPYTHSKKGKTTLLMIVFLTYFAIEMLTVYLAYLFVQAGPNIVYYPQVVNSLIWNFGTIAFLFAALAGIWAWSAKYHHFVLDWQIQPLIINAEKSDVDFYILTSSSKLPVSLQVQKLLKLSPNDIEKLIHEFRQFQQNIIDSLKDQAQTLGELNNMIGIQGYAIQKKNIETAFATETRTVVEKLDTLKWVMLTMAVSVSFGLAIYVAMGGRL